MLTSGIIFELFVYAITAVVLVHLWRTRQKFIWVVSAAMLASALVEIGNMYLARTYFYADALVMLGTGAWALPLYIPLAWGVVLFGVMTLTRRLPVAWYLLPLADAFLAVALDLMIDPVASNSLLATGLMTGCHDMNLPAGSAIGVGLWTWCINPKELHFWLGIPLENFSGWFALVAVFSFTVRYAQRKHNLDKKRGITRVWAFFAIVMVTAVVAEAVIGALMLLELAGVASWLVFSLLLLAGLYVLVRPGLRRTGVGNDFYVLILPVWDTVFFWSLMFVAGIAVAGGVSFVLSVLAATVLLFGATTWLLVGKSSH